MREGAKLAQICQSKVMLLAVIAPETGVAIGGDSGAFFAPPDRTEHYRSVLAEGDLRLRRMGLSPQTQLVRGDPADHILAAARDFGADLVVVGQQQQGNLARWFLGSLTSDLADKLGCSLLVGRLQIDDAVLFDTARSAGDAGS